MIYRTILNMEIAHKTTCVDLCHTESVKNAKDEAIGFCALNPELNLSVEVHDENGPLWFGEVYNGVIEWSKA